MALKTYASATIRGITYKQGDAFTCYYSAKGNGGSEGNGNSAAALTKGKTYYFLGYVVAADSGSTVRYPYKIGSSISTGSAIGYYREEVFPYATYKITYNANGGSGAPSNQTKTYGTALTLSSTKPTRAGYTFKGWNTKADGSGTSYASGASYTDNKALTLYAVWNIIKYSVKFDKNTDDTVGNMPSDQTKNHGAALTLSDKIPTRTNYTFKGWGTSAATKTVSYAAGASYTNNAAITLFAIWELSYTKPRINNLRIDRCDSSGDWQDDGSDIRIEFDYELDKNESPTILFSWKVSTAVSWIDTVSLSDPQGDYTISTGTYKNSIFAGKIDPEKTYTWQLIVSDSGGSTTLTGIVSSLKLAIDVMPPKSSSTGDNAEFGVSIGKTAEKRGVFDVALKSQFRKEVLVESGIKFPVLAAGKDFDDVRAPGQYPFGAATTFGYKNCPINSATSGVLEVIQAGDGTQLLQRITTCSRSAIQTWERCYHEVTEAAWGSWARSGARLPSMSAYLSGNQTTVGSSYTKIDFASTSSTFGLTLTDGGIKIGAGISYVLVSLTVAFSGVKANGMKHIKIKRNSTNCEWISGYAVSGNDLTLTISPRLMSVSENDIITATYYTTNADETISAGSSGNGWKTCLTVVAVL